MNSAAWVSLFVLWFLLFCFCGAGVEPSQGLGWPLPQSCAQGSAPLACRSCAPMRVLCTPRTHRAKQQSWPPVFSDTGRAPDGAKMPFEDESQLHRQLEGECEPSTFSPHYPPRPIKRAERRGFTSLERPLPTVRTAGPEVSVGVGSHSCFTQNWVEGFEVSVPSHGTGTGSSTC